MRRCALLAPLASAVVGIGLLPALAWGADNGTVNGTVSVPAATGPCITLSGTSVNLGTAPAFSSGTSLVLLEAAGPTVNNCAPSPAKVFAQGSNATAANNPTWSLVHPNSYASCPTNPLNMYRYQVKVDGSAAIPLVNNGGTQIPNSSTSFTSGQTSAITHGLIMPCTGSGGAGATYAMSVLFTTTF